MAEVDEHGDWNGTELGQIAFSRPNDAVTASQTMAQQLSDASTSLAQTTARAESHNHGHDQNFGQTQVKGIGAVSMSLEHKDRKENNYC